MHVCYAASEAVPFVKVGGLADVVGSLPAAVRALGHRATVVLPMYGGIDPGARSLARLLPPFTVAMGDGRFDVEVFEGRLGSGVEVLLIRQPGLFERDRVYGDGPDEPLRFAVFCRALLRALADRGQPVDVLHCHDWPTALVPYYLRRFHGGDGPLAGARSLLTIHNIAHQPLAGPEEMGRLGVDPSDFHPSGVEFYGKINILKAGMVFADRVSTVSPTYAREIATPEGGNGLDGVVTSLASPVVGILNGIDPDLWDPAADAHLPHRFSADAPQGRFGNKMALQRRLGLPVRPRVTLVGVVARLVTQKGLDLVVGAAEGLLRCDVQIVIVGDGDPAVREPIERLAADEPARVRLVAGYNEPMSRLVYGASDLFLVPSRFEPGGLTQMIAMRYGAVPVARATGGLADTVIDLDARLETGTGFVFADATPGALLSAVQRGVAARASASAWRSVIDRIMRLDYSWAVSARRYDELYRSMVER